MKTTLKAGTQPKRGLQHLRTQGFKEWISHETSTAAEIHVEMGLDARSEQRTTENASSIALDILAPSSSCSTAGPRPGSVAGSDGGVRLIGLTTEGSTSPGTDQAHASHAAAEPSHLPQLPGVHKDHSFSVQPTRSWAEREAAQHSPEEYPGRSASCAGSDLVGFHLNPEPSSPSSPPPAGAARSGKNPAPTGSINLFAQSAAVQQCQSRFGPIFSPEAKATIVHTVVPSPDQSDDASAVRSDISAAGLSGDPGSAGSEVGALEAKAAPLNRFDASTPQYPALPNSHLQPSSASEAVVPESPRTLPHGPGPSGAVDAVAHSVRPGLSSHLSPEGVNRGSDSPASAAHATNQTQSLPCLDPACGVFELSNAAPSLAHRGSPPTIADPSSTQNIFHSLDQNNALPPGAWIHSGVHRAEAGYLDPALGWVGVRAEALHGSIHAALMPSSTASARSLVEQLGGLHDFLRERQGSIATLTVAPDKESLPFGFSTESQGRQQRDKGGEYLAPTQPPAFSREWQSRLIAKTAGPVLLPASGNYISVMA